MQHNWMMFIMLILMGNVIYFTACNVDRLDNDLNPDVLLEQRNEGECRLIISGNIVSTKDLLPLEDVVVNTSLSSPATITTDENGAFLIELTREEGESLGMQTVEITSTGFIPQTFTVDLNKILEEDCPFLTQVEWNIGLTPLQDQVGLLPDRPVSIVFTDTLAVVDYEFDANGLLIPVDTVQSINKYRITVPKVIAGRPNLVSITPNHNFSNGAGICPNEGENVDGLTLEDFYITASEGTSLVGKIRIEFIPRLGIQTGSTLEVSADEGYIVGFSSTTGMITLLLGSLENFQVVNTSFDTSVNVTTSTAASGSAGSSSVEFSNCNCGDPTTFGFNENYTLSEQLSISFPPGLTPLQQDLFIRALQNTLNIGSTSGNTSNVSTMVIVVQCELVTLETGQVTRNYTGTFGGVTFNYNVFGETETDISSSKCPTSSSCHQGCPE